MKLIEKNEFILNLSKNELQILKYKSLLEKPLKLEMFVPCDADGNTLEEPDQEFELSYWDYSTKNGIYHGAKEKVLFEGFQFTVGQRYSVENKINLSVHNYTETRLYITKKTEEGYCSWFQIYKVEDLVQCELDLTKSAINLLGL